MVRPLVKLTPFLLLLHFLETAADALGRKVKMYAVEKNPNAVITLRHMVLSDPLFQNRVQVISGDMRDWKAPEKADIMVSELLGSFGDNELSPECLDGTISLSYFFNLSTYGGTIENIIEI